MAGNGSGGAGPVPAAAAFCPGCGRPQGECAGCGSESDPWHYCPGCGRWLAVQVIPTGWTATCRGCGAQHRGGHR